MRIPTPNPIGGGKHCDPLMTTFSARQLDPKRAERKHEEMTVPEIHPEKPYRPRPAIRSDHDVARGSKINENHQEKRWKTK